MTELSIQLLLISHQIVVGAACVAATEGLSISTPSSGLSTEYPLTIAFPASLPATTFTVSGLSADDILTALPSNGETCPIPGKTEGQHILAIPTAIDVSVTCQYAMELSLKTAPFSRTIQLQSQEVDGPCSDSATITRFFPSKDWIVLDLSSTKPALAHVPLTINARICGNYLTGDTLHFAFPASVQDIAPTTVSGMTWSIAGSVLSINFNQHTFLDCSSTSSDLALQGVVFGDITSDFIRGSPPVDITIAPVTGSPSIPSPVTADNWQLLSPDAAWHPYVLDRRCKSGGVNVNCDSAVCTDCSDRTMEFLSCVSIAGDTPGNGENTELCDGTDQFQCHCTFAHACTYRPVTIPDLSSPATPPPQSATTCDISLASSICSSMSPSASGLFRLDTQCLDQNDTTHELDLCGDDGEAEYHPSALFSCGTVSEGFAVSPSLVSVDTPLIVEVLLVQSSTSASFDTASIHSGLTLASPIPEGTPCAHLPLSGGQRYALPATYAVSSDGLITITRAPPDLASSTYPIGVGFPLFCRFTLQPSAPFTQTSDQPIAATKLKGSATVGTPLQVKAPYRVVPQSSIEFALLEDDTRCSPGTACGLVITLPTQPLGGDDVVVFNSFPGKALSATPLRCAANSSGPFSQQCASFRIATTGDDMALTLSAFDLDCFTDEPLFCKLDFTRSDSTLKSPRIDGSLTYHNGDDEVVVDATITIPVDRLITITVDPDQLPSHTLDPLTISLVNHGIQQDATSSFTITFPPGGDSPIVDLEHSSSDCSGAPISYDHTTHQLTIPVSGESMSVGDGACSVHILFTAFPGQTWEFQSGDDAGVYALPSSLYFIQPGSLVVGIDASEAILQHNAPTFRLFSIKQPLNAGDRIAFTSHTAIADSPKGASVHCRATSTDSSRSIAATVTITENIVSITALDSFSAPFACGVDMVYTQYPVNTEFDLTTAVTVSKYKTTAVTDSEGDYITKQGLPMDDTVAHMVGFRCRVDGEGADGEDGAYTTCDHLPSCFVYDSETHRELIPDEEVFCVLDGEGAVAFTQCRATPPDQTCYQVHCRCGVSVTRSIPCDCAEPTTTPGTCQKPCRVYTQFVACSMDSTPVDDVEGCPAASRYFCTDPNLPGETEADDEWEQPGSGGDPYPPEGESCAVIPVCQNNDGQYSDQYYDCALCLNPDASATSRTSHCTALFFFVDEDGTVNEDFSAPPSECSEDDAQKDFSTCFHMKTVIPTPNDEGVPVVLPIGSNQVTFEWEFIGPKDTIASVSGVEVATYGSSTLNISLLTEDVPIDAEHPSYVVTIPESVTIGNTIVLEFTADGSTKSYSFDTGYPCDPSQTECVEELCQATDLDCGQTGHCAFDNVTQRVYCACDDGFYGSHCQYTEHSRCSTPSPTTCVNGDLSFSEAPAFECNACVCRPSWTGAQCHLCPPSSLEPCSRGNISLAESQKRCMCVCQYGFAGPSCTSPVAYASIYFDKSVADTIPLHVINHNFVFEDAVTNPTYSGSYNATVRFTQLWERLLKTEINSGLGLTVLATASDSADADDGGDMQGVAIAEYRRASPSDPLRVIFQLPDHASLSAQWTKLFQSPDPDTYPILSTVSSADQLYSPSCGEPCQHLNPYPSRGHKETDIVPEDDGGLSGGIIALIVIIVVVVVVALVLVYIFLLHQRLFGEVDDTATRKPSAQRNARAGSHHGSTPNTDTTPVQSEMVDLQGDDEDEVVTYPWKKFTDHLGNTYYMNMKTMETTSTLK